MDIQQNQAPGRPGIIPRWTSSAKIGVGTALGGDSDLWFTISHGIVNEVYYPRIDQANIRDMGFIVTDGQAYISEEKRHAIHYYQTLGRGIPAYRLTNQCGEGRYRIEKRIVADPRRCVLLQHVQFVPLRGSLADYRLFMLVAPHLHNMGSHNSCWVGDYKGAAMLFAQKDDVTLACGASAPFLASGCGFVGVNDPWRDLMANKRLTEQYQSASDGNVAMAAQVDLQSCQGSFTVALAFGRNVDEAGLEARAALTRGFEDAAQEYVKAWQEFQDSFDDLSAVDEEGGRLFHISNAVLKIHEGKHFSGSVIASLSVPWGFSKGDNDLGGYHLIWPRDQVQTAQAQLAAGDKASARQVLLFLMCTQEADGHWAQCMWDNGAPYWRGLQLDETALPILLVDQIRRHGLFEGLDPIPMVTKAAQFIIKRGPHTEEDRWEEMAGYTPYTVAVAIAALLAAADLLADDGSLAEAEYLREVADWWYASIDRWLYVTDTALARQHGVAGYYVRVRPAAGEQDGPLLSPYIDLKNLPPGQQRYHYSDIVSVDALALVRLGLRRGDDPRIGDTVRIIDALLKSETSKGPIWHRYNHDGYGEHDDGSPFDGTGVGRGWPLLVGERAHYELARGDMAAARALLRAFAAYAGEGGLLPEQIWDGADRPGYSLYNGHSAGSAKPLVWAHAEYITLLRSLQDGAVFGMPPHTQQRYLTENVEPLYALWRFNQQCALLPHGKRLRVQCDAPGFVRWTKDGWGSYHDLPLQALPKLALFFADLPAEEAASGSTVAFTFYWEQPQRWEGRNFSCVVA